VAAALTISAHHDLAVWLPCREDAESLVEDFIANCLYLTRITYPPFARALVADVYDSLTRPGGGGRRPATDRMALFLCLCALSAFHWNSGGERRMKFASDEDAARCSCVWRRLVWDLLSRARRDGIASLEAVQAKILLEGQIYAMEGSSSRFKYLLNSAIAEAKEISLHLTDSLNCRVKDDCVTKEVKRRVWWHLTATDW
jgi:hypothetical protein